MKYFKHDLLTREDDKIWELVETHGVQGYGLWWVILEELYKSEEQGFQIHATETWFKKLGKQLNLTDWRTLLRILDTMSEVGLINSQLWAEHVIHAPGISKRADDYIKAKEQARVRKQRQREKEREAVSRVTHAGQTECHATVTTNTDSDPDSDSNSDLENKEKEGAVAQFDPSFFDQGEPSSDELAPNSLHGKPQAETLDEPLRNQEQPCKEAVGTGLDQKSSAAPTHTRYDYERSGYTSSVAKSEERFKRLELDPWQIPDANGRWHERRGKVDEGFCEWLAKHYLPTVDPYKSKGGASKGEAIQWVKAGYFNGGEKRLNMIDAQWENYQEWQVKRSQAQAIQSQLPQSIPDFASEVADKQAVAAARKELERRGIVRRRNAS